MSLYLRLAWRNMWRQRRRTFIVLIAIGFTMALMMVYDGVIAGFEQAIYANAIRVLGGNIQAHAYGYRLQADQNPLLPLPDDRGVVKLAQAQPQVEVATRRINTAGMTTSREGAFAVNIIGIEPEQEEPFSLIAQNVTEGRYLTKDDGDFILIGKGLAVAMNVAIGDRVTLVGRDVHNQMRQRTMTVVGVYDLGMPDIERGTLYVSLAKAQELYGLREQTTEVVVMLKQLGQEPDVLEVLQPALPELEVTSWETNYPELEATIQTKGGVMNVFGVVILFIAGIGILNLLFMAVYERTREIGILAALGLKPRQISILFLLEGTLMGLMGVAFGVALGLLINSTVGRVGIDYSQFAGLTEYTALISGRIYFTLGVDKLPMRIITTLIISTLAAFFPAREASHHEPAEALHFV